MEESEMRVLFLGSSLFVGLAAQVGMTLLGLVVIASFSPATAAGQPVEASYLKASNTQADDRFGSAVAMWGDTVVVGAPGEDGSDDSAPLSGAAYVYVRDGSGSWSQQAYLKADSLDDRDELGYSVGVAGSWIIAGAPFEDGSATGVGGGDDNSTESAGAVYVFEDSGGGNWAQTEYLKASNSGVNNRFGTAAAIAGTTIVVAAPDEGSAATGVNGDPGLGSAISSGAAYVFEHAEPDGWGQTAYIKAFNTGTQDRFGRSVSASDNLIVIGAHQEGSGSGGRPSDNSRQDAGAAYVYRRELDGTWSFDAYHKALRPGTGDVFGHGVAVAGEVIVVAALEEDSAATAIDGDQSDNSADGAGAVFAFRGVPWFFSDRFAQ